MLRKVLNLPWIDPIRRRQQPPVGFQTLARRCHPGFEADQGLIPVRASFQVASQLNDHCFQRHLLAVDAICRPLRSPEKDRLPIIAAAHQQVAQGWIPVAKDEDILMGLQSLHLPWRHMFEVLVRDRARHHSLAQLQVALEAFGSNDHRAPNILGSSSHGWISKVIVEHYMRGVWAKSLSCQYNCGVSTPAIEPCDLFEQKSAEFVWQSYTLLVSNTRSQFQFKKKDCTSIATHSADVKTRMMHSASGQVMQLQGVNSIKRVAQTLWHAEQVVKTKFNQPFLVQVKDPSA